jgi:hypothetical protein
VIPRANVRIQTRAAVQTGRVAPILAVRAAGLDRPADQTYGDRQATGPGPSGCSARSTCPRSAGPGLPNRW